MTLAGFSPYLFIDRQREVKKYKGLKIFFDDIKLLGKYIEIEYQDSENAEKEMKEFCDKCGIYGDPQPLYGEIINVKYDTDESFRKSFDEHLSKIVSMEM